MKTLMTLILTLVLSGCESGGGAAGGSGGGVSAATAEIAAVTPTVFTFEISGNGVTFSADMHGYSQVGFAGSQVNPTYNSVLLGAATNTYTMTAESMISSFTLNTGAGVLTIVTKKNGSVIRTDTISTNATNISISN